MLRQPSYVNAAKEKHYTYIVIREKHYNYIGFDVHADNEYHYVYIVTQAKTIFIYLFYVNADDEKQLYLYSNSIRNNIFTQAMRNMNRE